MKSFEQFLGDAEINESVYGDALKSAVSDLLKNLKAADKYADSLRHTKVMRDERGIKYLKAVRVSAVRIQDYLAQLDNQYNGALLR